MDGAETLFAQLISGGVRGIQRIVREEWPESLVLDFKAAARNTGPMHADDRKNLGEALSGFANSDGGVIVWGVRADRQSPSDPDVAKETKPIRNVQVFLSDLLTYTPQLVSPPIIGVRHEVIAPSRTPATGYVVSYVPRGEGDPHMSMAKGEHRYFCRSGTSFIQMEHYMLADRFHRRVMPNLEFTWRLKPNGIDQANNRNYQTVELVVGLRNIGSAMARQPALIIAFSSSFSIAPYGLDGNTNHGLPQQTLASDRPTGREYMFAGGADQVIYPGTVREVTRFQTRFDIEDVSFPDVTVSHQLYADAFSKTGQLVLPGAAILSERS